MVDLDLHVLLLQAISFLLTLWLVKRYGWGPLMTLLADRQAQIRSDYKKAEEARHSMEEERQIYEQKIAAADAEARSRIVAAEKLAEQQAEQIVKKAQEEAQAVTRRAQEEMARERAKVLAELRNQVAHLSVAIAGKIINETLDENKHRGLVDDFINRVGTLS